MPFFRDDAKSKEPTAGGESTNSVAERSTGAQIEWNWSEATYVADWHEPIFSLLSRYIVPGSRVLEIGAGGSHTLSALSARLDCDAFGIEPDPAGIAKSLELSKGESARLTMIRGDGFYLPFDKGEFDVVYSLGLVEHYTPEEIRSLMSEHVRVCKPEGLVIVAVPNILNLPHTLRKMFLGKRYEFFPERSYTPGQLQRIMTDAGLRLLSPDGLAPLWALGMTWAGWRIVHLLDRVGLVTRLNNMKRPKWRAAAGFMTYSIGRKKRNGAQ